MADPHFSISFSYNLSKVFKQVYLKSPSFPIETIVLLNLYRLGKLIKLN